MRVAVLSAPRTITLEDRPEPKPGVGEVIVRIASVGVCGSDVHYYEEGRIGNFVVEEPLVLGHEAAGTVVAVGDGVTRPGVGDGVSIGAGVADGWCCRVWVGRKSL